MRRRCTRAGAHRIVVVNWHEGNSPTLRLAADEAQRQHGVQVVIAESHVITHTLFPGEMEFTHAGSMETAAVLACDAAWCTWRTRAEPATRAAEVAHGLFRRPDVIPAVLRDFRQIAATGWYGRPERATPGPGGADRRGGRRPCGAPASARSGAWASGLAGHGRDPGMMRAALLRDFGALDVAEVATPVPGHGEVLVRVRACGICGTDLKIVGGASPGDLAARSCRSSSATNGRARWQRSARARAQRPGRGRPGRGREPHRL